jgi:cellulose synthase/poly-beta-1,6-N-acetylglucosamine synthase-like glycosyltransferase
VSTAEGVVFAVLGGYFGLIGLYQIVLAIAAFFHRADKPAPEDAERAASRLVVLVPAHDEAGLIGRCVESLRSQSYPDERYDVVVIADNCADDTAGVARAAGAEVLVRHEPDLRGKGRALRWALDRVAARTPAPDGIVVVDADSVADSDFLATLARPFEQGRLRCRGSRCWRRTARRRRR